MARNIIDIIDIADEDEGDNFTKLGHALCPFLNFFIGVAHQAIVKEILCRFGPLDSLRMVIDEPREESHSRLDEVN